MSGRVLKRRSRTAPADRGFTLLETLVALTILSLSVAVLFGIFSQAVEWSRSDSRQMDARVLAQSILARAKSSPPNSDWRGIEPSGLSWGLRVAPFGDGDRNGTFRAETLTATVRWESGDANENSLTLTTLALVPEEPGR